MDASDFNNIIYDKDERTGIVLVTINRPEIKNALSILVLLELNRATELFESDDSALAMVVTGAKAVDNTDPANEAFSSGGYFNPAELESLDEENKGLNKAFASLDFWEALAARKEKRDPVFKNK
jgi:enoyl-CoA hydratase/carnithine racemase